MRDLGKLIVAKGFKSCPNSNKSPNLVTLAWSVDIKRILIVIIVFNIVAKVFMASLCTFIVNMHMQFGVGQKWGN